MATPAADQRFAEGESDSEPVVTPDEVAAPRLEALGPERFRCEVTVPNELGLHVRPATEFVKLALAYECEVTIHLGSQQVDGKSAVDILTLAAEQGSRLILETHGPDAERALDALARLILGGFDE